MARSGRRPKRNLQLLFSFSEKKTTQKKVAKKSKVQNFDSERKLREPGVTGCQVPGRGTRTRAVAGCPPFALASLVGALGLVRHSTVSLCENELGTLVGKKQNYRELPSYNLLLSPVEIGLEPLTSSSGDRVGTSYFLQWR